MATGVQEGTDCLVIGMSPKYKAVLNRVQGFAFNPAWDTAQHSQFGNRTPIEIIKTYKGVTGSIDLEVVTDPKADAYPHATLLALLTDQDPDPAASVVSFDPANFGKLDLISNVFNGDPEDYTTNVIKSSYFVKQAEASGSPYASKLGNVATRTIDFDATTGIEIVGALTVCQFTVPTGGITAGAAIKFNPYATSGVKMNFMFSPKTRGTAAGRVNQLNGMTTAGAGLCVAAMKSVEGNYHLYAYKQTGGVYTELKNATSTATAFSPKLAMLIGDVISVVVVFTDAATIQ